jgi:large subunit ribosomal protein L40e
MVATILHYNGTTLPISQFLEKKLEESPSITATEVLAFLGEVLKMEISGSCSLELTIASAKLDPLPDSFELRQLSKLALNQDPSGKLLSVYGYLPNGFIRYTLDGKINNKIPTCYESMSGTQLLSLELTIKALLKQATTTTPNPPALAPITLNIMTLTGKSVLIQLPSGSTISDLKDSIEESESIPTEEQRLIYGGKQLEDGRTLNDYYLGTPSPSGTAHVVHLVLRLRGGMLTVTNGRVDYVSILFDNDPDLQANNTAQRVIANTLQFTYFDVTTGRTDVMSLVTHPEAKVAHALNILRAEFEPFFFNDCTLEILLELPANRLSPLTQVRLVRALRTRLGADLFKTQFPVKEEGDEEEDEEDEGILGLFD